jgi:hypothetical protein
MSGITLNYIVIQFIPLVFCAVLGINLIILAHFLALLSFN